jgi:hypothetical protein
LEKARSPPVFQLPLDCTYCRTSTGGAMTQVECAENAMLDVGWG